jgi:sortase A
LSTLLLSSAALASFALAYLDYQESKASEKAASSLRLSIQNSWVTKEPAPRPENNAPPQKELGVQEQNGFPVQEPTSEALISIPRLKDKVWQLPARLGSDSKTLAAGLGLYEGESLFGAPGNAVLVGHRTSHGQPFHDFERLQPKDQVFVETSGAVYVYELFKDAVVDDSETWVMSSRPSMDLPDKPLLSLITCTPKGSTSQRWVWWGYLIEVRPK